MPVCPKCGCQRVTLTHELTNTIRCKCKKCKQVFYTRKAGKCFYIFERRDSSSIYKNTLISAGYVNVSDPRHADFLLYDLEHEAYLPTIKSFADQKKPIFEYPHSANSWYFWDGFHKEFPVSCNFVFTDDIKSAMISYGYKSRAEPCGFSFSEVKQSTPTARKTLLYAPMHTMGMEGSDFLRPPASFELNRKTLDKVFQLAPLFERVTIRYGKTFEASGMYDPRLKNVHFEKAVLKSADCIQSIQRHDVVIAAGTLAYISVALGKPTILFNQKNEAPREMNMTVKSYEKYKHFLDYPIQISDMTDEQIMNFAGNERVEQWKKSNIGEAFNASKFLGVIREYVK